MALRFISKTALCAVLATFAYTPLTYADIGYLPYYEQNRDAYQFATMDAPVQDGAPAPLPPPISSTNWQQPQAVFKDREATIMAPTLALGTRSGLDAGLEASYYRYNAPSPDVKISGPQLGATASASIVLPGHMFDTADFRYGYGRVDYSSATLGTSNDHENALWEIRDVVGQDFLWNRYSLSPYLGLGYRNLYNDDRGITSSGASGFRSEIEYLYVPIGVKPQVRIDGANILAMDAEFDYLAHGWQTSHLEDKGLGDPTVHNGQGTGFGFRGEAMWETSTWSFGPFVQYWNIGSSSGATFNTPDSGECGSATCTRVQPHNITVEGGLQLKYHFLNF